jgi:hypothetical protein
LDHQPPARFDGAEDPPVEQAEQKLCNLPRTKTFGIPIKNILFEQTGTTYILCIFLSVYLARNEETYLIED